VNDAIELQAQLEREREAHRAKVSELRVDVKRVESEAAAMLAGDYADMLALVDVSLRRVDHEAEKLVSAEARALRKAAGAKAFNRKVISDVADHLEERAKRILRAVQTPAITQYRQDRSQKQSNKEKAIAQKRLARCRAVLEQIDQSCDDSSSVLYIRHLARQALDQGSE
jgi:hypothetical protein